MMTVLSLMTAIYWGQLSKCKYFKSEYSKYSCSQPDAYGAVCAFAVFLFIIQLAISLGVTVWRGDLISESAAYDQVPSSVPHSYDAPKAGGNSFMQTSADL